MKRRKTREWKGVYFTDACSGWIEIAGLGDSENRAARVDYCRGGLIFFLPPWISTSVDWRFSPTQDSACVEY